MLGHECSFPNSHFLDSVVRNNKRSSGIDGETSDFFPEIVYIAIILSNVFARNFSESSEPVIVFSLISSW